MFATHLLRKHAYLLALPRLCRAARDIAGATRHTVSPAVAAAFFVFFFFSLFRVWLPLLFLTYPLAVAAAALVFCHFSFASCFGTTQEKNTSSRTSSGCVLILVHFSSTFHPLFVSFFPVFAGAGAAHVASRSQQVQL
jgi:hypothetical protein